MAGNIFKSLILVISLGFFAACARDSEDMIEARLSKWFHLGDRLSFQSKMRCTAAVFEVTRPLPKPALAVQTDLGTAKRQFRLGRVGAFRIESLSPNDLADALLLEGDGVFGKEALAAVAQAGPCFRGTGAERILRRAFTRPGATLVYDREGDGVIVLDPVALVVVYVAADVW